MDNNNGAIIMVDFENVGLGGLEGYELLTPNDTLYLFVSDNAKSIKKYIAEGIARTGVNVVYRKLVNTGKNGLDFYITSEIGYLRGVGERRNVAIISKDKGYGAVVDYWKIRTNSRVFISNTIETGLRAAIYNNTARFESLYELTSVVSIPLAFDFRGNAGADINIDNNCNEDVVSTEIAKEIESAPIVNIEVKEFTNREDKIDDFLENCKNIEYSTVDMLRNILNNSTGMCNLHNLLVKATTNSRGQKIYSELKKRNVEKLF